jgi:pyrroline-5-carboxylate reductase
VPVGSFGEVRIGRPDTGFLAVCGSARFVSVAGSRVGNLSLMNRPERLDLLIIGGGNMGEALLGGLISRGVLDSTNVVVVEAYDARREHLSATFPGLTCSATLPIELPAGVLVAVKPHQMQGVCAGLRAAYPEGLRVLSIAAGVSTGSLEAWLGHGFRVVRAMPNTPAFVGHGASGVAGGASATDDDVAWSIELLSAVGIARSFSESQLDAVTGLSGSGPAYVFLVAEALTEAGVLVGLSRDDAAIFTAQTLLGAATLLAQSPTEASTLRANVTSPGGTTAAGLRALENRSVRAAFIDAVVAATARATELKGS